MSSKRLMDGKIEGSEDEEDVMCYWMTLRKQGDAGNWKTKWHSVENLLWKRLHVRIHVRPVYVATSGNL